MPVSIGTFSSHTGTSNSLLVVLYAVLCISAAGAANVQF